MTRSGKAPKAVLAVLATVLFLGACGEDGDVDTEATRDTVEEAARDAREAAEDAFASLRTDGDRLIDEIRTMDAPQAKEQLLERCRDTVERLRKADSDRAEQVDSLCDRVRDTDVSDTDAWDKIKQELNELR